jgi:hypothetical protein
MLIPTTDNGRHRVLLTPHPCKLPDTLYFRTFAIDIFQDFVFTYPRTAEYLFHYRLLNHVRIAKNQHLIIAFFLVTAISPIAIVVKKRSMKTFDGHFLSRSSPEKFEKPIVELILLFLFKIGQYKVLKCIYHGCRSNCANEFSSSAYITSCRFRRAGDDSFTKRFQQFYKGGNFKVARKVCNFLPKFYE